MRRVEVYLRTSKSGLISKDRNNLRFYVAMHVAAAFADKSILAPKDLAGLDVSKLDDELIQASLDIVKAEYVALGGTDRVAKGPHLVGTIQAKLGGQSQPNVPVKTP